MIRNRLIPFAAVAIAALSANAASAKSFVLQPYGQDQARVDQTQRNIVSSAHNVCARGHDGKSSFSGCVERTADHMVAQSGDRYLEKLHRDLSKNIRYRTRRANVPEYSFDLKLGQ